MKKLPTALALSAGGLAALLLMAWGVGSLPWRPAHRSGPLRLDPVAAGEGPLLAGAAVVPLEPAAPVPVAGFPRRRWMESGARDPIFARAVVLSEPGCAVALVSLELVFVTAELDRAIQARLRPLHLDAVVVAATHTHAGPGGYWDDALGERAATGPYQPAVFEHLVERAATAVERAAAARQPASLAVARGRDAALAWNRGGDDGEADGRLVAARLTGSSGRRVADLVLFPAHATLLGPGNTHLSGDWPGALMRSAEAPLLLFQGALGDQAPAAPDVPGDRVEAYARALARDLGDLAFSAADPRPALAVATATAVLPSPDPGAAPGPLRPLARNVAYGRFPGRARVAALRLGALTLLAVPGEPVAEVGRAWRARAGEGTEILALAGGYVGYVETPARVAAGRGETRRTYYGAELAERLGAALQAAAARARGGDEGARAPPPTANR